MMAGMATPATTTPHRRATDPGAPLWRRHLPKVPIAVGILAVAALFGTGLAQVDHNSRKLDVTSQKADAALAAVDQLAQAEPGSTVVVTIPPTEPGAAPMTAVVQVVQSAQPTSDASSTGQGSRAQVTPVPSPSVSTQPMTVPSHAEASASAPVSNPGLTPAACVAFVVSSCVKVG